MACRLARTFILVILALVMLTSLFMLHEPTRTYLDPYTVNIFDSNGVERDLDGPSNIGHTRTTAGRGQFPPTHTGHGHTPDIHGAVIMGKLGNETAKQQLGRAAWKLMHTMTLRYPENPTDDERAALETYFHLQARLYPCGECAAEFQELLRHHPPQTSSRRAAVLWLCHVHNLINSRLGKAQFDCSTTSIGEAFDCGCGDETDGERLVISSSSSSSDNEKEKERERDAIGPETADHSRDTLTDGR